MGMEFYDSTNTLLGEYDSTNLVFKPNVDVYSQTFQQVGETFLLTLIIYKSSIPANLINRISKIKFWQYGKDTAGWTGNFGMR